MAKANPRHILYDRAILAGHKLLGGDRGALPDWWPEIAPLTKRERALVRRAIALGARPGDQYKGDPQPGEEVEP